MKLSANQIKRLIELYNAFQNRKSTQRYGWEFSRDLRTDESLYKRGLVARRGIPGDVWHSPEYAIKQAGYMAIYDEIQELEKGL